MNVATLIVFVSIVVLVLAIIYTKMCSEEGTIKDTYVTQLDADYVKYVIYNELFPTGTVFLTMGTDAPPIDGITWSQVDEGYIIASASHDTKKYAYEYWSYDPSVKAFIYTSSSVQYVLNAGDIEDDTFKRLYNSHYITSSGEVDTNTFAFYLDTNTSIQVYANDGGFNVYMNGGDVLGGGECKTYRQSFPYDPSPTYFVDGSGTVNVYNYGLHITLNKVSDANDVLCMLYDGDMLVAARSGNTMYYSKFNIYDIAASATDLTGTVSSKKVEVLDNNESAYYDFTIALDTTDYSETITGSTVVKLSDARGHTHKTQLQETMSGEHSHTANPKAYNYSKGSYDADNDSSTTKSYNWDSNLSTVLRYRTTTPSTTYHVSESESAPLESSVPNDGKTVSSKGISHTHEEQVMYLEANEGGGGTGHNHTISTTIPVAYVKAWVRTDKNTVQIPNSIDIKNNELYSAFANIFIPNGTIILTTTKLQNEENWECLSDEGDFILVSTYGGVSYNYDGSLYTTQPHILENDEIPQHRHDFRSETVSEKNISTTTDITHLHSVLYRKDTPSTVKVATNTTNEVDSFPVSVNTSADQAFTLNNNYSGLHTHEVSVESMPTSTGTGHIHTLNYKYLSVYVYERTYS